MEKLQKAFMIGCAVAAVTFSIPCMAMVYDNQFFPLFDHPIVRVPDSPSYLKMNGFFCTGDDAYGDGDSTIEIPELFGTFDLGVLARSMQKAGFTDFLNEFGTDMLPLNSDWNVQGTIQAQGFTLYLHKEVACWLSVGLAAILMRVNSTQYFLPERLGDLNTPEFLELDALRRAMFQEIGLCCGHSDHFGASDLALYVRLGWDWDYVCKFRHIDAGLRLGVLFPTGRHRIASEPASLPFGGQGGYGIFARGELELEVKEDLICGAWLWVSKRFKRTDCSRMPVGNEPFIYAPLVGPLRVEPGTTIAFYPYVRAENLREGFGASIMYLLRQHWRDSLCDRRTENGTDPLVPSMLQRVEELSEWRSDYVILSAFYDFGKLKCQRTFEPIVSLTWDVPTAWIAADNFAKTHRVLVGIQLSF